ncbi:uracil-DNA glycosylase [Candidatus Uabimicrobium sp. HlEnr_7]|uniref:uracil-DNA glycosylase n=1 Tax=Candidatus Uabimicrobium helgolandensis TaxID=3095367 RepID=UPI0035590A75
MDDMQKIIGMIRERLVLEKNYTGNYALVDQSKREELKIEIPNEDNNQELQMDSPTHLPQQNSFELLNAARQQASSCTKCKLAETRTKVVFGTGSANADLVIVGEAPGYYEDQSGEPFVGKAGQLLTKMLAAIQIRREDVYICNVIKCRPPNNRNPSPDEIVACRPWLQKQLEILRPKVLCSMGKFAAQFLTNSQEAMWKYRDKTFDYEGIPVICTYHPAYLLRNTEEKKKAWVDLKRLKALLIELQNS